MNPNCICDSGEWWNCPIHGFDKAMKEIAFEQAAEQRASVMRRNLDQAGNEAAQFQRESWE